MGSTLAKREVKKALVDTEKAMESLKWRAQEVKENEVQEQDPQTYNLGVGTMTVATFSWSF